MSVATGLLAAWCLLGAGCGTVKPTAAPQYRAVTVQNTEARRDVAGEIIDAHDGGLQFFDGRYYLYGTAYGKSAGFCINNRFRVYSSADLEHWRFEGELIEEQPVGVFYRPYVVYNAKTRKYVLWFNWYPKLWDGAMGVAVSDTPIGPFKIVGLDVKLSQAAAGRRRSLFVDDDGTGYFIYTVIGQGHAIRVERLTPDYLGSAGATSEILARGCEAPGDVPPGRPLLCAVQFELLFLSARQRRPGLRRHLAARSVRPPRQHQPRRRQPAHHRRPTNVRRADSDAPGRRLHVDGRPLGIATRTASKDTTSNFGARRCSSRRRETSSHWKTFPVGRQRCGLAKTGAPVAHPYVWPKRKDPIPSRSTPARTSPYPGRMGHRRPTLIRPLSNRAGTTIC